MYWAIIPCKTKSSRIKYKNLQNFNGHPLVRYTVAQALASNVFDGGIIITSTIQDDLAKYFIPEIDDDKVMHFYRGNVDVNQPANEYIYQVLRSFPIESKDTIVLLQPTCPCREPSDIAEAIKTYELHGRDSLVSVQTFKDMPRCYVEIGDDVGHKFIKYADASSDVYVRNSSIYICKVEAFLLNDTIFLDEPALYKMPDYKSIDINTHSDLLHAAAVFKNNRGKDVLGWKPQFCQ